MAESGEFGCDACWPESAEEAWEGRSRLAIDARLIDESHLDIAILRCTCCNQRFVTVFTENIDWVDGHDPQYWFALPLTDEEAAELMRKDDAAGESDINDLGPGRRCLRRDNPKGETARTYWSVGIWVGPHD